MNLLNFWGKTFKITFLMIIIVELLSLLGYTFSIINTITFIVITLLALVISLWRLKYGLWIIITELVIGSKGYLFSITIGDFDVSIRLALFLMLLIAGIIYVFRKKSFRLKQSKIFIPLMIFIGLLVVGLLVGLLGNNETKNIFYDWNGYLYFGLIFIFFEVIRSWKSINRLLQVIFAGVSAIAIKTLFLITYFAHQTDEYLIRAIYRWVRVTGVGEITQFSENYYRIFFQSHIYSLFIFFIVLTFILLIAKKEWNKKIYYLNWTLIFLTVSSLIISFSRSIWLSLAITLFLIFIYIKFKEKFDWKKIGKIILISLVIIGLEIGLITFLVSVKIPGSSSNQSSTATLLKERLTTTDEAAIGSRLELLKPLVSTALKSPIWGSGFGKTVTYQTLDPRTKEKNGGWHTTYAFEWGYLDIVVKMGLLGLLAYLYLIWVIIKQGINSLKIHYNNIEIYTLVLSFLFGLFSLIIIHFTTPYLNHPLGIGFLMIVASIFYFIKNERQLN